MDASEFESKYRIGEVILENNNFVFYKAISIADGKSVLLKSIRSGRSALSEEAYLSREYELLKELHVKQIPGALDLLYKENVPFLVLTNPAGEHLMPVSENGPLPLDQFFSISKGVTSLLQAIHENNIMHKGIYPENIFLNTQTNEITLIDFGQATKLNRERSFNQSANGLEGNLKYISPEQTGRMNRSTDYRTDFYSLGLCFYKLLTGTAPFKSNDPVELVYSHIAKNIDTQVLRAEDVPEGLIAIINKLTSKVADDRYQSARGLLYDLEYCYALVQQGELIPQFQLGQKDVNLKFSIPETLFGRNTEMELLLNQYNDVCAGESSFLLVKGQSGIGKTAMIDELHKPAVQSKGIVITGKFDQYKTNIPFLAFSKVISDLIKQVISEPAEVITSYKASLKNSLGSNASVLLDLNPNLGVLLDKQGESRNLNPTESQNRLFFAIVDFIRVFATQAHPLILILDDLQWSDDSSLMLLGELARKKLPYLFLIGAYRDNEVSVAHPLYHTIEAIKKSTTIHEISLGPLRIEDVNLMLSGTLHTTVPDTQELSQIVYRHTNGNPYYVSEFLKNIYSKGLVDVNHSTGHWSYDLTRIANLEISGNILDIVEQKINKLPPLCLRSIEIASCIGYQFELKTLAALLDTTPNEAAERIWPAIADDIIIPLNEKYKIVTKAHDFGVAYAFQHDKIHQAVYQGISEELKTELHYKIGQFLLVHYDSVEVEEKVIEIVRHLNISIPLVLDDEEKLRLALLNSKAGLKAQTSVAYGAAKEFFENGISLLLANSWQAHYSLTYALYYGYALNSYQTGDSVAAETTIGQLLENAASRLDRVAILSVRLRQYTTQGKTREAIQQGIQGLAVLGIRLPENPGALTVLKEVLTAKWKLRKKKVADLLHEPEMSDPEKQAAARLLSEIGPAAYTLGNDNLYALTSLKVVNLSLNYGNSGESSFAYITLGAVLAEAFGDYKTEEELGKLALALNYHLNSVEYRCRVIAAYGVLIHHLNQHWAESTEWFLKGIEAGYQSGDLFFLAYCASSAHTWDPTLELSASVKEQKKYLQLIADIHYLDAFDLKSIFIQHAQNLRGLTSDRLSLNDENFDEATCLEAMHQRKYYSGIGMFYTNKADLCLMYSAYGQAREYIKMANRHKNSMLGNISLTRLSITTFFTNCALLNSVSWFEKISLKREMNAQFAKMKKLATHCPANFLPIYTLMKAEVARLDKDFTKAAQRYEESIDLAKKGKWLHYAAFANELAARFYLEHRIKSKAAAHIAEAVTLYQSWGATGKVSFLQETYPDLLQHTPAPANYDSTTSVAPREDAYGAAVDIDLSSIIKYSQAISGEIVLESLLKKMIEIITMNAGAEKGVFLIENEDILYVQAHFYENKVTTMQNIPLGDTKDLPHSILNYVAHSKDSVVLGDATREGEFTRDPVIQANGIGSILCSPIILMNELYGVIYLENNKSKNAFTQERLTLLNLLSSQMAISIQNALLYSNLEQKVASRTAELTHSLEKLKATQNQLIQAEKMASLGDLTAGIAHELKNPLNFINNFSEITIELVEELLSEQNEGTPDNQLSKEILDDLKGNLDIIYQHGQRADSVVKSMLLHSRKNTDRKEVTNLNALADESLRIAYYNMQAKDVNFNAKLNFILDPELTQVEVIPQEIGRALLNLFNNAFYAVREKALTAQDQYHPEVCVSTKRHSKYFEVFVRDNGTGIPPAITDKIFQPFFTTKPTGQGVGLGLSLAYDIITKGHNGEITVKSRVGVGTKFTMRIPFSD